MSTCLTAHPAIVCMVAQPRVSAYSVALVTTITVLTARSVCYKRGNDTAVTVSKREEAREELRGWFG